MSKRKSFLVHIDSLEVLDDLTNEQAGELFKAMKAFHLGGEVELNPLVKIAFSPFKNQFIRDDEKYIKLCEKNKLIADNRYSTKSTTGASGSQSLPETTKSTDNKNDSDSDSDSKNKTITKEEWTPPEGLNLEAWNLFVDHRKELKKPLKTDRMKTGQANKLKDLTPDQQLAVVNLSMDEGWVGLFPEKITAPQQKPFNQPAQQEGAKFRPYVHEKTERTKPPEGMIDSWRKLL
jgi:hypothetical protein